jgi:hypothetical protein
VRAVINSYTPLELSDKDLWSDRTTHKNKFRYFKNALALFDFVDQGDGGYASPLKASSITGIRKALVKSDPTLPENSGYGYWYWLS